MVEDSNVKEETKDVIKARLEILNDVVLNLSDYTKKTDAAWEWILENCK